MRVLIVEDDMILAGHLGPSVVRACHELVGLAADRGSAIALLQSIPVDFAFVDVHLADGWTGVDVVRAAVAEGATAAFTTANSGLIPPDFAGACGAIDKPYTEEQIVSALAYVVARLDGGGADVEPPSGFTVSPFWTKRLKARAVPRGPFASRTNLHP